MPFSQQCHAPSFGYARERRNQNTPSAPRVPLRQLFEETFIPEAPTFMPNTRGWRRERGAFEELGPDLSAAERASKAYALAFGSASIGEGRGRRAGWKRYTVADFERAYSSGTVTPVQVAENVIAAVEEGMRQVGTTVASDS